MAFRVPTFNLTGNIYRFPGGPPGVPSVVSACQLRASGNRSSGTDGQTPPSFVWEALFPLLTDVRDRNSAVQGDAVEIPAGSGRVYRVMLVDDVAKGFANEYRIATITKLGAWPAPIP